MDAWKWCSSDLVVCVIWCDDPEAPWLPEGRMNCCWTHSWMWGKWQRSSFDGTTTSLTSWDPSMEQRRWCCREGKTRRCKYKEEEQEWPLLLPVLTVFVTLAGVGHRGAELDYMDAHQIEQWGWGHLGWLGITTQSPWSFYLHLTLFIFLSSSQACPSVEQQTWQKMKSSLCFCVSCNSFSNLEFFSQ